MTDFETEFDDDDAQQSPIPDISTTEAEIPPRIDSAFRMLYFMLNLRCAALRNSMDQTERETYYAALHCAKRYFDGEDIYEESLPPLDEIAPTEEELKDIEGEDDEA